jgi:DNA-binding MarR family transcriptional regulator/predicted RNA-binding protein with PUA-like domain
LSRYCGNHDSEPVIRAAEHWCKQALKSDGSVFSEKALWRLDCLEAIEQYYVNQIDESDRTFLEKLKEQLTPTTPETKELVAEMLWVMLLCPSNLTPEKKREDVNLVWSWSGQALSEDLPWLSNETLKGVGSTGQSFSYNRWRELVFFVRFMIAFKRLDPSERDRLLQDGWAFAELLKLIPEEESRQLRHMILFLLFPDQFERSFSRTDRRQIVISFTGKSKAEVDSLSPLEIDRELLQVRRTQEEKYGTKELDYYVPPLKELWARSGFEQFTKDITREHVLKALEEIDRTSIPADARSTTYDLIEGQRRYPPKLVLSLASKYASGTEFDRSLFTGGEASPAFALLRKLDFHIERKDLVEGEHENDLPNGKRYWIFQANPKYYDIDSALKQLAEQTWLVPQSHKQIQVGDTAYIWRSGQNGGIIAVASVLTKPAEMLPAEGEQQFNLDAEKFAGKKMRVRLHIDRVLVTPISREQLKSHAVLSSLTVLSFANATNFGVQQNQAEALEELIARDESPIAPRVWIEKTLVKGRPGRETGDRALGRALWSPQRDKRGGDIYHWMRETKRGDIVIHLTDNRAFTAISTVDSDVENVDGLPGTEWATGPCYLLNLRDFKQLDPELLREEFFAEPYRERLLSLLESGGQNLFYNRELNLNQGSYFTPAPAALIEIINDAYKKKAHRALITLGDPDAQAPGGLMQPTYSLAQMAQETNIDESLLQGWINAVERKGQAIFYGPPGTGKTFVAERLARHLIRDGDGFSELVQFHPSYAYEDFIQGIRPKAGRNGGLDYSTVPGRFLEFCLKAQSRKGASVLIIDEINRSNLSRVFGELMYLLEYRDRDVPLSGGGRLRVPGNVRIIGTMNTADRSIALVDHALRRRFAFISLRPDYEVLRRFHAGTGYNVDGLITTLKRLNSQINDQHYEIGITFFLKANLKDHIEAIWTMEIEPYLEEYFFDQSDTVDTFRWSRVSASMS